MTPDFTPEDAQSLFTEVSKAMHDDDSSKLSELFAQESPEEKEQPVDDTPVDEPEDEDTDEVDTSDDESDDKDEEDKSADEESADDKPKDDDPLAALRAEIEALRKEQHALKSQAGRVGSIQRKLTQYDEQLAKLSKATSSQASEKITPEIKAALKDIEENDPVLAESITNAIANALNKSVSEDVTQERERIQALRDSDYAEYIQIQKANLIERFPNVEQVFRSNEWATWKKEQKPHMQALATSDDAEAVTLALNAYRDDMLRKYPELAKGNEQKVETKEEPVNEQARQIEEERKKAQRTSANLKDNKAPARSKEPSDPEALFQKFFKQIKEGT